MLKIDELMIPREATVLETMKKLDETGQRILFIAPEGRLQAVVTDGDIRKFFLRGGTLESPVEQAANFHPISLPVAERGRAKAMLQSHGMDICDASMSRLEGQARKVQDYELPILAEALDVSIEQLLNDEMANR